MGEGKAKDKRLIEAHSDYFIFCRSIFVAEKEKLVVGGGALLLLFHLVDNDVFTHEVQETSGVELGIASRDF